MQLASQQTQSFHYPTEEELELFDRPQTKKDLIRLMSRLKNSDRHYSKRVKYIYSGVSAYHVPTKKPKKQPVFKFYFNCCPLRPRFVFRQASPDLYVLDQINSSFLHEHLPSFPLRKRAPYGCKKHWKTIEAEKKQLEELMCHQEDNQVKIQDDYNCQIPLNTSILATINPHSFEKTPLSKNTPALGSQNIFRSEQNQPNHQNQISRILLEKNLFKGTRIKSPQKDEGRIIFSTQDKSDQQSCEEVSQNPSCKKKIFKSRLFFSKKSKGQSLVNRPWIFKPSNKFNWLQKSSRQDLSDTQEYQIEKKELVRPKQMKEKAGPISQNQLFLDYSKKSDFYVQENKEKKKRSIQRQQSTQNENYKTVSKEKPHEHKLIENRQTIEQLKKSDCETTQENVDLLKQSDASENQNIGIQDQTVSMSKAIYHTFQWYKKFTSKLFERKLMKPLDKMNLDQIRKELKIEKPFSANLTQDKEASQKFTKFWQESNHLLLKTNNFFQIDLEEVGKIGGIHVTIKAKLSNKIFISKKAENIGKDTQNSAKMFSDTIYLGMYPIKISSPEKSFELLIAYQITTKLEAKLVWFSLLEQTHFQESKEKEKFIIRKIMECFLKSIEFMKLSTIHFVCTTLKKRLVWGLCNLMKKVGETKDVKEISFSMHASCIEKLLELEKNKSEKFIDFLSFINPCMDALKDKQDTEKSKHYFANLLKKKGSKNQKSLINPRQLQQNFKFIRLDFHSSFQSGDSNLDISFFSSQFYAEKERFQTKDPVYETNQVLGSITMILDGFEELFPLLLTISNANFHKGLRIVDEHLIVPSNFMWKENELLICHQIFSSQQKNPPYEQLFRKLFKSSVLDLESVVKNCPRLLTQTVYRLIYFSSLRSITHEKDYSMNEDMKLKLSGYAVINSIKQFQVNVFETERLQSLNRPKSYKAESLIFELLKHSIVEELSEKKDAERSGQKEWNCECKFYVETGIPCEHEICCAITFKTSIYNEINRKWKSLA